MTIYELSIISTTGFPYFNKILKTIPKGVRVNLRFFDFSSEDTIMIPEGELDQSLKFDLKAGLVSALFEFAKNIDQKIEVLEFINPIDSREKNNNNEDSCLSGDVLITVTTEPYLIHQQVKNKVKLIYEHFITPKIPLDSAYQILYNEEATIIDILTDKKARINLIEHESDLKKCTNDYFKNMCNYGLEGIVITSCDLSPLICFSKSQNYTFSHIDEILRNIGNLPEIEPYNWKYRQTFCYDKPLWVYLINSGIGVTVEELFEPYYYLLIANPNAYLGEFPSKITSELNEILQ